MSLYDKLKSLTSAQLDDVCEAQKVPTEYLPGRDAPIASRAADLLKVVSARGDESVKLLEIEVDRKISAIPAPLAPKADYRPKVRNHNRYNASIDDYYDDFAWIWRRDLEDRPLGVFDLIQHVFDHASRVCTAVRLERPRDVIDDLADTSVWLMSFMAQCQYSSSPLDRPFHFDTRLSDLIWNKYPGICPICFNFVILDIVGLPNEKDLPREVESRHADVAAELERRADRYSGPERCVCLSRTAVYRSIQPRIRQIRPQLDALRSQYALRLRKKGARVTAIPDIDSMFAQIFANAYHVYSLDNIAFHLFEKVGSMTRAFKDLYTYDEGREPFSEGEYASRIRGFQQELADVFSWMFATEIKIASVYYRDAGEYLEGVVGTKVLKVPSMNFADVIWSKYGRARGGGDWNQLRCPGCESAPCSCNRDLRLPTLEFRSRQ